MLAQQIEAIFAESSLFSGDWQADNIAWEYERLIAGWFTDEYTIEDIAAFAAIVELIYTAPEGEDPSFLGLRFEDRFVTQSDLRKLVRKALSALDSPACLRMISETMHDTFKQHALIDPQKICLGNIFLKAAASVGGGEKLPLGNAGGPPILVDFEIEEMNYRIYYGLGAALAFAYIFLDVFRGFTPTKSSEWVGDLSKTWTSVWKLVENIESRAALKDAWLKDIRENKGYAINFPCEVVLGGFFGSILLTEQYGMLFFLLKSENGCIPGYIPIQTGESSICIENETLFYSEDETYEKHESEALAEMVKARNAVELLALGAWRDIVTRGTAEAFYNRDKVELLERQERERSAKKKLVKRTLLRYMPRYSTQEHDSADLPSEEPKRSTHYVAGFLRRLPGGHKASERQKVLAGGYSINIPEGFTFVSPHIRGAGEIEMRGQSEQAKFICYSALTVIGL